MIVNREYLLEGTISCGLKRLQHVLEIKGHTHLVSTMQEGIKRPTTDFIENALDDVTEELRLQELRDWEQGLQGQKSHSPSPF